VKTPSRRFARGALCLLCLAFTPRPAAAEETVSRLLGLPLPASFTFCGESVPLQKEDVAERLDLELMDTLGSPIRTALWFKRAPRYLPGIEAALKEKGLPQDLKYVAIIESNLRDDAVSEAGAVGPWQFMPQTGAMMGLDRTEWREGARDWPDSTRAAVAHLAELRTAFGSWALALAAYNGGRGRVSRALESQGGQDFYDLRLPRETERYVFRAFAAKLVMENPEAYGIRLEKARLYGPEDSVPVDLTISRSSVPLSALARAGGVSYRGLRRLNPWMTGGDLPRGVHRVRLPSSRRSSFAPAVARWEAENPDLRTVRYRVRKGETLGQIAKRNGVTVADLCAWNSLEPARPLRKGQELILKIGR
jgi:hypothetical protein